MSTLQEAASRKGFILQEFPSHTVARGVKYIITDRKGRQTHTRDILLVRRILQC